jgi:hypothetical protein
MCEEMAEMKEMKYKWSGNGVSKTISFIEESSKVISLAK